MPEEPELSFEEAVSRLEALVEALERGEPSLASALAKYDNGVRLLRLCYSILERAERSVAILNGIDAQGQPLTTSFDDTATVEFEEAGHKGKARSSKSEVGVDRQVAAGEPAAGLTTNPKPPRQRRSRSAEESAIDRLDPPF